MSEQPIGPIPTYSRTINHGGFSITMLEQRPDPVLVVVCGVLIFSCLFSFFYLEFKKKRGLMLRTSPKMRVPMTVVNLIEARLALEENLAMTKCKGGVSGVREPPFRFPDQKAFNAHYIGLLKVLPSDLSGFLPSVGVLPIVKYAHVYFYSVVDTVSMAKEEGFRVEDCVDMDFETWYLFNHAFIILCAWYKVTQSPTKTLFFDYATVAKSILKTYPGGLVTITPEASRHLGLRSTTPLEKEILDRKPEVSKIYFFDVEFFRNISTPSTE